MTKTKRGRKGTNGRARPIRTKRDYESAAAVVKQLSVRSDRDSAAELRLQSLLREMDKFDDSEEDADTDMPGDADYPGPHRRWSDENSED